MTRDQVRVLVRGALACYGRPMTPHELMDAIETVDDIHKTLRLMAERGELEYETIGNTNQRRYRLATNPPPAKAKKTKAAKKPAPKASAPTPQRKRAPGAGRPAKNFAENVHDGRIEEHPTTGGRIIRFGATWKPPREGRRLIDLSLLGWQSPLASL